MFDRAYRWVMKRAEHRNAIWWLAAVAFIESSIFPIPPDVLLIPMVLAAPTRWLPIALTATVASVLGGFLGYFIGFAMFETLGMPLLEFYHAVDKFQQVREHFNANGALFVAIAGFTPFPYKVITIASGMTQMDLGTFAAASVASRGGRFLLIAALLWKFGPPMRAFIEKRLALVITVSTILLVGGFALIKLL